ncbi:MAG: efflux RND transporter periplasmic adaptor subunit [Candidatus Omnitrophota bacterium]|jgi:macrolide-specific efflux system membrane fusion protein
MRNKKIIIVFAVFISLAAVIFLQATRKRNNQDGMVTREIIPSRGSIQSLVSATGTVYPKNRLEVKPPVGGRIESILVKEGEHIKAGRPLALMSSTERAALLDAARGQGAESLKYWQQVYKDIQLFSPIDGEVIVATTQPGQTVTTSDAVVVLSDKLIVRAQVDETDIGKIAVGQSAGISLDAYPGTKIKAEVEHIYYESETVNNVTIYKVDLVPESSPQFFRSGMNASIDFVVENKENILLVPLAAVSKENGGDYVLVKQADGGQPVKRAVTLGVSDDKNVEVASGLSSDDVVITMTKQYSLPEKDNTGSNPFMPKMPSAKKNGSAKK